MINEIIESISIALDAEFGEGYEIHMEEIKQGLNEPCFFILCINNTHKLFLGNRYFMQNPFVIQYFPESDDIQSECNAVAERMLWCLEYITINSEEKPIRGTKMNYEVTDGVLNFFVNYDYFVVRRVETETEMETVESKTSVKEGD